MGKTRNSGLGFGTGSSPQGNIFQGNAEEKIKRIADDIKTSKFDASLLSFDESKKKYDAYLLNLDHPEGGSKAKFLKETLGYQSGDSEKLHNAIKEAIDGKIPNSVEKTNYGTKYNFDVSLKGNNGKYESANVTIVVQNDNGKTIWRIITIVPGKKDK